MRSSDNPPGDFPIPPQFNADPHIKIFFKVGAKMAKKKSQNFFFDPPKNKKPSVQKVPLYRIYVEFLHLKLICTHQAHQNPPKTSIVEVKMRFWCAWWVQINFKCKNSPEILYSGTFWTEDF